MKRFSPQIEHFSLVILVAVEHSHVGLCLGMVWWYGMVLIYLNSVSQQYIVQLGKIRMT